MTDEPRPAGSAAFDWQSADGRELLIRVLEEWLAEGFSADLELRRRVARWALALGADPDWIEGQAPDA